MCTCTTTIHYRAVNAIASDVRRAPGLLLCSRLHGNNDILMMPGARMQSMQVDYKWADRSFFSSLFFVCSVLLGICVQSFACADLIKVATSTTFNALAKLGLHYH